MLPFRHVAVRALLLCLCLGLLPCPRTARADYTAVIDPTTQYQTFEGWGTSLCWFANVLGAAPLSTRQHFADMIFDTRKGLGLNVVRYNIGGGENPIYNSLQFRARVPGYEAANGTYNWQADANQRWFLQAAIARGADQIEAFSNSPPYWMTNSGSVSGSVDGTSDNLSPNDYDAFASYLAAVTQRFQSQWRIIFRDVEPFNESSAGWWKFGGGQEGCHFDRSTQNTLVKKLGGVLSQQGLLTTVAAADENSIDDAVTSLTALDGTAQSYLTKVNTHSYGGSRRVGLWNLANSNGKSLWMSEYGDGDGTGLTMSEQILADMRQMHPTAWVYWQAIDDSSAPGWGMIYSNLNNPTDYGYTVNEKYWVMANYSKFILPGYKLIFCNDGQSLAAYNQAAGILVIVTTNNTGTASKVTYDLSAFNAIAGPARAYRTSANESLAALGTIALSGKTLVSVAAAQSVTTYVVRGATYTPAVAASINDNDTGAGLNRFQYNGVWQYNDHGLPAGQNDYHLSRAANSTATLQFQGTQALLYGLMGRTCGIAAMSIDGGPEEERNLGAGTETGHALIYASPTLPYGLHTLKVRVTGRVSALFPSGTVYIDRADIVGATPPPASGAYMLVNRNSGDLLDISQSLTTAGTVAIQWPYYDGPSQMWQLKVNGNYNNLVNINSGLSLDVNGASASAGADVIQWYANGGTNQDWSLVLVSGLYYKLVNRNSGLNLDVNQASTADGAKLIQWTDNGGWNQQWAVLRAQ